MTRTVAALAVAALTLTAATVAQASITRGYWTIPRSAIGCYQRTPPERCLLRWWVRRTWHAEDYRGMPRTPFARADLSPSVPYMRWAKLRWRARAIHVLSLPIPQAGLSAGFIADLACISAHEEYGLSGPNTVAGYFGFIYPPSGYLSPGPALAREYGDSWLDVPLSGQEQIAYALYQSFGWSPWSTAGQCGL